MDNYFKWALFLLLISFGDTSLAQTKMNRTDCPFQVFEQYCLGGNLKIFLALHPKINHHQIEGDLQGIIYQQQDHDIYLMAYKGKIYKVLKKMNMNTLAQFHALEKNINRSYGASRDISQIRVQDRLNQSTYLNSIAQGYSDMAKKWTIPNQSWHIELSWNKAIGIALSYKMETLSKP